MRKNRRRNRTNNQNLSMGKKSKEIVELWALKILLNLNGHREFIDTMRGITDDSLAYFLGLDKFVENYEDKDKKEIFQMMKNRLEILESKEVLSFSKILNKNIKKSHKPYQA